ncbi:hypothetical protein IWW39_000417 [Coemansia spiralis]|uniref:Uncharacterized protein n=1 Tax=Coemansia spiralis TaxID=417178 RepID=A0A9W8GPH1_9FUNG|nr:hypothetical protein IWW39_000417 [Coemansia spiralis]
MRGLAMTLYTESSFVADRRLPISSWNKGAAEDIASIKRFHMSTVGSFDEEIQARMRDGPLRDLALDMYRALFRHPGTFGTRRITNAELEEIRDDDIAVALRALPVIDGRRDPLALLYDIEIMTAIMTGMYLAITGHGDDALAAQHAAAEDFGEGARARA